MREGELKMYLRKSERKKDCEFVREQTERVSVRERERNRVLDRKIESKREKESLREK